MSAYVRNSSPPTPRLESERDRQELASSEPELRARTMGAFADAIELLADIVAKRMGRSPDDIAVRTLAGGLVGALMAAYVAAVDKTEPRDVFDLFDATLAQIEAGLPL